jgi:hypothetical protein
MERAAAEMETMLNLITVGLRRKLEGVSCDAS